MGDQPHRLAHRRAHFIFFIILWLVCWAAREKIWRDTYLIAPLENMVKRILH